MSASPTHNLLNLFSRLRQGDQKAFDQVFHLLYPSLCYYCYGYTKKEAAAKDIASEAFINLWQKRSSIKEPQYIKTFLFHTARNMCLTWLEQENRANANNEAYNYITNQEEAPVSHHIIRSEVAQQLHHAIKTLPPQCSRIFRMLYFEGKTPRQVAEELQLSVSTVYNQQAYGLSLLRKRLGGLFTWLTFISNIPL